MKHHAEEARAAVGVDGAREAGASVDDVAHEQLRDARVDLEKAVGPEAVDEAVDAPSHARLRGHGDAPVLGEPEQREARRFRRAHLRVCFVDALVSEEAPGDVHEPAALAGETKARRAAKSRCRASDEDDLARKLAGAHRASHTSGKVTGWIMPR